MIATWLSGLVRHRARRLAAVATGVLTAVALLAAVGAFLLSSRATMTERAVARVAVDWQGQVATGVDPAHVAAVVAGQPGTRVTDVVGFAAVPHLVATTAVDGGGSTVQTTGAAQVLGLPPGYRTEFPRQLRTLADSGDGVLVASRPRPTCTSVWGTWCR